jgi:phospholipid/cholesterol/gamma-HCH transport system substrate-binding protein
MKIRDFLSFIAFGVMTLFAIADIGSFGIRIGPPDHRTNVSMTVSDVNSLVVGSNVLLRGVPVGKVSKIDSSVAEATVDFYIDGRYQVPVDSDVRLDNLSALGESYIGLVPRRQGGPMLQDGQRIATESVKQPASISELATSVVRVLDQLDPGQLERIVGEADTALPPPNSVLPNITHASNLLRNAAADTRGRGRELLDNFQTLLQNSQWLGPTLADITPSIRQLGPLIQALFGANKAFLTGTKPANPEALQKFKKFLDERLLKFLDVSAGDIQVLGEAISPQIKGIGGALMNFDTGQILANMLASLPEDGAVTLHVSIPEN